MKPMVDIKIKATKKTNNNRKFSGGGPRPDNNEHKRAEAKERDAAWRKLTPTQQLAALDRRLGKGVGAAKQRARLIALIEQESHKAVEEVNASSQKPSKLKAKERRARERGENRDK